MFTDASVADFEITSPLQKMVRLRSGLVEWSLETALRRIKYQSTRAQGKLRIRAEMAHLPKEFATEEKVRELYRIIAETYIARYYPAYRLDEVSEITLNSADDNLWEAKARLVVVRRYRGLI